MALTLTEAFLRESEKEECVPAVLVTISGVAPSKFLMADRPMFGYPNIVQKVSGRQSGLDPLKCTQKLNSISIDFVDDGPGSDIREVVENYELFGKKVTLKLGFNTGSDATYPEASFAAYCAGLIDRIENEPGVCRIILRDARTVMFERKGMTTTLPAGDVVQNGEIPPFEFVGAYTSCMLQMLTDTNMGSPELYDAASYAPAASPRTGHLTVMRTGNNGITEPENLSKLLDEIALIARGYNLVQEDGIMRWREFDPTAAAVDRFLESDIVPDSFRVTQDYSTLVYTVSVNTGYGSDGYAFQMRASDADGQAAWSYSDGSDRQSDFVVNDKWFGSFGITLNGERVDITATNIRAVLNAFAGAQDSPDYSGAQPNAVDATDYGMLWIRGITLAGETANRGEFIKYETITKVAGSNPRRYLIDGLTRGQLGTAARHHNTTTDGPSPILRDLSAPIRCAQEVIKRFREGAATVEFQTPLHKYGVQLADVVNIEHPLFLRFGQDGLAVGNVIKFECVQKEVDLDECVISWKFVEIRAAAHTTVLDRWGGAFNERINPEVWNNNTGNSLRDAFLQNPFFSGTANSAGALAQAFLDGELPVAAPGLEIPIPWARVATRFGVVSTKTEDHTFTALRDTYVDIHPHPRGRSFPVYEEVANGAAAPAVADGHKRAWKIVTDATDVTSVVDLRDVALVDGVNVKDGAITNAKVNAAAGIVGTKLAEGAGVLTHLSAGGVFDSLANITNRILDLIDEGVTYGKVKLTALTSGEVDLSKAGVINKTLDNVSNGAARYAVTAIDGAGKAIVDLSQAHTNALPGSKLLEGTGPLTNLSNGGFLDALTSITSRPVDSLTDGTYARPLAAALSSGKLKLDSGAAGLSGRMSGANLDTALALEGTLAVAGSATIQNQHTDGLPFTLLIDRATTNHVKNPSFEVNVTDGWTETDVDSKLTVTRETGADLFLFGEASAKFVRGTAGETPTFKTTDTVAITGGETWTVSAWVKTTSTARIGIVLLETGGTNFGRTWEIAAADGWTRIYFTRTTSGSATAVGLLFQFTTDGATYYVDGVQLEEGTGTTFCDGSLGSGYSWSGTAHNSASSRAAGQQQFAAPNAGASPFVIYDDGRVSCGAIFPADDTASRIGLPGRPLRIAGAGTVFPESPSDNDIFFRTDDNAFYYYDSSLSLWLSVVEHVIVFTPWVAGNSSYTVTTNPTHIVSAPHVPGTDIYITRWVNELFIGATNTATHRWIPGVAPSTGTNFTSYGSDVFAAGSGWNRISTAVASPQRVVATDEHYLVTLTKSNSPTAVNMVGGTLHYRHVRS